MVRLWAPRDAGNRFLKHLKSSDNISIVVDASHIFGCKLIYRFGIHLQVLILISRKISCRY